MNKTDVMEKIYLEYKEKVFRYVKGNVRNVADAEDVNSEIFLNVQKSLDYYDEEKATLSTWIYTITHNAVCNYYRKESKRALSLYENNVLCLANDDGVMAEIENEILKEQLVIALETLTEREQDIIVLYYYHEMPLGDIAIKMGITYTNAKFIKHNALRKLKLAMQI